MIHLACSLFFKQRYRINSYESHIMIFDGVCLTPAVPFIFQSGYKQHLFCSVFSFPLRKESILGSDGQEDNRQEPLL